MCFVENKGGLFVYNERSDPYLFCSGVAEGSLTLSEGAHGTAALFIPVVIFPRGHGKCTGVF